MRHCSRALLNLYTVRQHVMKVLHLLVTSGTLPQLSEQPLTCIADLRRITAALTDSN